MELNAMTLLEVRSKLDEKIKAQKTLVAGLKEGDEVRSMNDEEKTQIEGLDSEIEALEARSTELIKIKAIEERSLTAPKKEKTEKMEVLNKVDEFRSMGNESNELKLTLDELRSIAVGADAQAVGIGTQSVDFIADYNPQNTAIAAGVKVYSGLVGDVVVPRFDGTSVSFVTENGAASESGAFSGVSMKPRRISGTATISKKFLIQNPQKAAQMVMESFAKAVGYTAEKALFTGSGSTEPMGILNYATTTTNEKNKVSLFDITGATPTDKVLYNNIIKGKYNAIGKAGNQAVKYVVSPEGGESLESTLLNTNSSKFILDNDRIAAMPALVDGSLMNSGKVAIAGDFSNAAIGIWDEIDIVFDIYSAKKTGNVEITVNAFADVAINRPELFSVIKWN